MSLANGCLSFIIDLNKEAAYIAKEMEELIYDHPEGANVKARQFIQVILRDIFDKEEIEVYYYNTIHRQIRHLLKKKIIPNPLREDFELLRLSGNAITENDELNDVEVSLLLHKAMHTIAAWYYKKYSISNFEITQYEIPQRDSNGCLVEELVKLKESSKEAVESLKSFSGFKDYMHVERNVQKELQEILEKASQSEKSQLVLVCGSVGDGKSHIISYFKDKQPELIAEFKLYNDATESDAPSKTSMETLNERLVDFSDDNISKSEKKIIIAINLGTLNNFIEKYGVNFGIMKNFVHDKKIFEKAVYHQGFDPNENFQFIDFSAHNLFTLNNGKVASEFIKSFINKITNSILGNPFYESYQENCLNCVNTKRCPIKANYDLLKDDQVQTKIVDLLVQCIIKDKIIISTRALLNFIYDLLVSRNLEVNSVRFKNEIAQLQPEEYLKLLTPNLIFEQKELSFIFKALRLKDPLNLRSKELDDFILDFNNTIDILPQFDKYITYPENYLGGLETLDLEKELERKKGIRRTLLKLFIRSYYLCGKGELFILEDKIYRNYITYLYSWNKGDISGLKNMYREIRKGIYNWNGQAPKDQINIALGKNQTDYKISEEMKIVPFKNLPQVSVENEFHRFLTEIEVTYEIQPSKVFSIELDYSLYELLIRVGEGYRPNKKDKNRFILFTDFLAKLEKLGSQNTHLTFTQKNKNENKQFKLEYDDTFESFKFMEIC